MLKTFGSLFGASIVLVFGCLWFSYGQMNCRVGSPHTSIAPVSIELPSYMIRVANEKPNDYDDDMHIDYIRKKYLDTIIYPPTKKTHARHDIILDTVHLGVIYDTLMIERLDTVRATLLITQHGMQYALKNYGYIIQNNFGVELFYLNSNKKIINNRDVWMTKMGW